MNGMKQVLIMAFMLMTAACATTVQLQVKRAPEINLPGVKTIKIEPFAVSGDLSLDENKTEGGGFLGAIVGLALDAGAKKTAEAKHPGIQQAVWNSLQQAVFKDGYFKMTNGSDYDALITGSIRYSVDDKGEEKTYKVKDKLYQRYEIQRTANSRVEFTVADKSGQVIGVSNLTGSAYSTDGGEDRIQAQNNSTPWDKVVIESLSKMPEPFLHKIAPYVVTEIRTFENGESPAIKEGNQAARNGDWTRAMELWKQGQGSGLVNDQIAALYNLGIYEEMEGRLQNALANFEEVYKLSGEAKYRVDIARTQARIEETAKLQMAAPAPQAIATPAATVVPSETIATEEGVASETWKYAPEIEVSRFKLSGKHYLHQFDWAPCAGASGYQVYATRKKNGEMRRLNQRMLTQPQLRIKPLSRGPLRVQVLAFDRQGKEIGKSVIKKVQMP